jgi:6-phosphogluconate dehydrogenase
MQIGFIGLGRMGGNMVHRLRRDGGHEVVGFDPSEDARRAIESVGATSATSLEELVSKLTAPRAVWMMVPAGDITESTLETLLTLLEPGDVIVDGGNNNYKQTVAHAAKCRSGGVELVDAGTSGGIWGLEKGYCIMAGGEPEVIERLRPIFTTLAPPDGFLHVGPVGSGHYVKMVHNGIEYGMLQAYAEGFHILQATPQFGQLDLHGIAHLWNQGSVVRSWLLELAEAAFEKDPQLDALRGWVDDTGEGRWTANAAIELGVPAPVITLSLMARFQSRQPDGFGNKVIAALRNEFGGHAVKAEGAPAATAS